jgi:hypothetical protein
VNFSKLTDKEKVSRLKSMARKIKKLKQRIRILQRKREVQNSIEKISSNQIFDNGGSLNYSNGMAMPFANNTN